MTPLRRIWKNKRFKLPAGLYRVHGDSMLPALKPGRLVLVRQNGQASIGDIVVIYHERLHKIKRLADLQAEGAVVLGDNTTFSTDSRHFGPIAPSAIVGRVLWPRA